MIWATELSSPRWTGLGLVLLIAALASYVCTMLLAMALRSTALRSTFLDQPNARSSHVVPTPRGGGIALGLVIATTVLLNGDVGGTGLTVLLFTSAMALLGLIDDLRSLPAWLRLVAQVTFSVSAALRIWGDASLDWPTAVAAFLLTTVWLVGVVNAYNFMDGIDGISALHGVLAGAWFTYLGFSNDAQVLLLFGVPLLASCAGFLPHNLASRIFLGDVGSYLLGSLIALLTVVAWNSGASITTAASPLLLYLVDTGWVVLRRVAARRSLTLAHREHVYQRLVDGGYSHTGVALSTVALSALLTTTAGFADFGVFVALAALVLGTYLYLPTIAVRR